MDRNFVKKAGVIFLVIIILVAVDMLILSKAGVFQWWDIKNTYQEQLESGSAIKIYKDAQTDSIVTVLEENNDTADNIDISNDELDKYIDSVDDEERKALMKDYFFLPSVPQYRIQEISDLTLMERAKYLAEMPIEDLRAAVKVIQDNVDESIRIQNEEMNK